MLSGVSQSERMVMPVAGARTQSLVPQMAGLAVGSDNVCVAAARVAAGCIVFLGDVNAEAETCAFVRHLCGLAASAAPGVGAAAALLGPAAA